MGLYQNSNDPMRNAALSAQATGYEFNRSRKQQYDKKRKIIAYAAMGALVVLLVVIIMMFIK